MKIFTYKIFVLCLFTVVLSACKVGTVRLEDHDPIAPSSETIDSMQSNGDDAENTTRQADRPSVDNQQETIEGNIQSPVQVPGDPESDALTRQEMEDAKPYPIPEVDTDSVEDESQRN